jgi:hypothetical protein
MKVGQINKFMEDEFESLDNAMEHIKLKKPHQLGLNFDLIGSPTS